MKKSLGLMLILMFTVMACSKPEPPKKEKEKNKEMKGIDFEKLNLDPTPPNKKKDTK